MSRLLIRGSAKSLMRVIILYSPFCSQNCEVHERPQVSKRQNSYDSVSGNILEWKVSTSVGLNYRRSSKFSFVPRIGPMQKFRWLRRRTAAQSTWEGAAELGIPRTIAPPNEIFSWLTYSHRVSSMDLVTWIRQVVQEGALYCYSIYLLIFFRWTTIYFLHGPMCGT